MLSTVNLMLMLGGLLLLVGPLAAAELSGYVAGEVRAFPENPLASQQHEANLSIAVEPEFYHEWSTSRQSILVVPFLRLDQHDPERTHGDIRELYWQKAARAWELKAGIGKVYWGVTESQHLVDIINQTDLIENTDTEDKLGQPMVSLTLIQGWGNLDAFVLPGFRKRTFPGDKGRLRSIPRVDTDQEQFESGAQEAHVDWALRWSHTLGDWDIGLAHFTGTSREPRFLGGLDAGGAPVLIPRYDQIDQTSLDLQATKGGWLWKLEMINRSGQGERFAALTGGFEYTFVGVFGTSADVGLLAEYLYDERGKTGPSGFEDDVFVGTRVAANDAQSTELLAGVVKDRDTGANFVNVEASRRLGDRWKLILETRFLSNLPVADPFFNFRRDDTIQLELARYF